MPLAHPGFPSLGLPMPGPAFFDLESIINMLLAKPGFPSLGPPMTGPA